MAAGVGLSIDVKGIFDDGCHVKMRNILLNQLQLHLFKSVNAPICQLLQLDMHLFMLKMDALALLKLNLMT